MIQYAEVNENKTNVFKKISGFRKLARNAKNIPFRSYFSMPAKLNKIPSIFNDRYLLKCFYLEDVLAFG